MTDLIKVTMNVTEQDSRNVKELRAILGSKCEAEAISHALSWMVAIEKAKAAGADVLLKYPNGKVEQMIPVR